MLRIGCAWRNTPGSPGACSVVVVAISGGAAAGFLAWAPTREVLRARLAGMEGDYRVLDTDLHDCPNHTIMLHHIGRLTPWVGPCEGCRANEVLLHHLLHAFAGHESSEAMHNG